MGSCISNPQPNQQYTTYNQKIPILIAGATGTLGSLIAKHCLQQPNLLVNILVRDRNKNKELADQVERAGGRVIIGDLEKPETLVGVTRGMHTVISAVSSPTNPDIFVGPQIALVNEAVKSGVQRFVPSDFGVNYTKFTRAEIAPFVLAKVKLEFADYVKTLPIKTLHIWTGALLELFFTLQAQGLTYWGDNADVKFDFTSYEDTARFTAAAVARKDQTGDVIFVANELSFNELSDVYNRVRGTRITPKRLGSLYDVKRQYDEKVRGGDHMGAFMAGFGLILNDPRAKFDKMNNYEFPEVRSTPLNQFLREHPESKFA